MISSDGKGCVIITPPHLLTDRSSMSHLPPGSAVVFPHLRYNGVPLISYSAQKKKKQRHNVNNYRGNGSAKSGRAHHNSGYPQQGTSWDDYYRCMDFVGEPLMLLPRGTTRIPQQQQYFPMAYQNYHTTHHVVNYSDYFPGSPSSQMLLNNSHHRDSFSSCSSSDSASSGSASPVHFGSYTGSSPVIDAHSNSPKREWIYKLSQDDVPEVSIGVALRVMSYNILAEQYVSKRLHSYCPSWALAWPYRKERIREDIEVHSPDIMCLQEVTMGEFHTYFLDTMRLQGYNGIFSPKSRANTMDTKNRQVVDGCAIVFRSDRFELVHQHLVEFNQLAIKNADGYDGSKNADMINRVMTKDNIALCAVLRVVESATPSYVLVVNVHVHWDPEYSDVKLIQTMLLMCEVERVVQKAKFDLNVTDIPMIFCGDLNSLPSSGVVEFLQNSRISLDHADFKDLPYRACLQKLSSQGRVTPEGHFCHPFALKSVYEKDDMAFTNFTPDFKGVIDYVFVSKDKIKTVGVLGPIENSWMEEHKPVGFPCPQIPSDHLPLIADLELIL